jgi:hypothetical protein
MLNWSWDLSSGTAIRSQLQQKTVWSDIILPLPQKKIEQQHPDMVQLGSEIYAIFALGAFISPPEIVMMCYQ